MRSRAPFFFHVTATTAIYTLSLHDALPIFRVEALPARDLVERPRRLDQRLTVEDVATKRERVDRLDAAGAAGRSEEHTSELQSQSNLVCRLLLEKKK